MKQIYRRVKYWCRCDRDMISHGQKCYACGYNDKRKKLKLTKDYFLRAFLNDPLFTDSKEFLKRR